ncbi:MAG: hypothetical protein K0S08_1590 [Gammaproteobacteria bacterium]|jgi:GH24 family phage-related lysozyme (muramidase)|nr:hypothetical protein [Gammaproteobacteria bacterium]
MRNLISIADTQPLLIDLKGSSAEYGVVSGVVSAFNALPKQNIKEFLAFFESIDTGGPTYQAFQSLMILFEGKSGQTYDDGQGNMTIGIGLNLKNPVTEAIIIAVNKKFGKTYDYKQLASTEGLPPFPGMSFDEIAYMFYLSLIGVTEQRPDGSMVTFSGEINALIGKLKDAGLDNTPFPANQLAALLSMSFNSPGLIGDNLLQALTAFSKEPSDLIAMNNVLIEIVERSNKDNTAGVANRRVMEAGVFLGSADKIHMSHRAVRAVLAVDPGRPLNGEDRYALPTGEVEKTWEGGATVVTEDGTDASHYNKITYGSTVEWAKVR